MSKENVSQEFTLKNIEKTRNYSIKKIETEIELRVLKYDSKFLH